MTTKSKTRNSLDAAPAKSCKSPVSKVELFRAAAIYKLPKALLDLAQAAGALDFLTPGQAVGTATFMGCALSKPSPISFDPKHPSSFGLLAQALFPLLPSSPTSLALDARQQMFSLGWRSVRSDSGL